MTVTKERLLELLREVGGAMEPGLAPVFNTHAEVHKLAQLIRNEVLEEVAQIDLYALIRDNGRVAKADAEYLTEKIAAAIEAMKEQL